MALLRRGFCRDESQFIARLWVMSQRQPFAKLEQECAHQIGGFPELRDFSIASSRMRWRNWTTTSATSSRSSMSSKNNRAFWQQKLAGNRRRDAWVRGPLIDKRERACRSVSEFPLL
jgi:hypothetical protein